MTRETGRERLHEVPEASARWGGGGQQAPQPTTATANEQHDQIVRSGAARRRRSRAMSRISALSKLIEYSLYAILLFLPLDAYLTLPEHTNGVLLSQVLTIEG